MTHYIEIVLYKDMEIALGFIWQKLYENLHLAFVNIKDSDNKIPLGVSFPRYGIKNGFPLGDRLRLFATKKILEEIDIQNILESMQEYLKIKDIEQIPSDIKGYAIFKRKQFKTNPLRLAKRYAKRNNVSLEEAIKRYEKFDESKIIKNNKLPYINYKSASTGQRTKIFIEMIESDKEIEGKFSTFGLSSNATVPVF